MQIIDLSHDIYSDMPIYPEDESPSFEKVATIAKEGYRETEITLYSHTGTHIDAPGHMLEQGNFLENIEIDSFLGKAIILNFDNRKNPLINLDSLKQHQDKINKVEFVIINTGWGAYWGQNQYYENYPYLGNEAAEWLSEFNLKGIGIDTISIDRSDTNNFIVHKTLLAKNIIIIENLTNLGSVQNDYFMLSVLPLKYKNADGSPVRAIAIEDI
ncbi:MAG TPA: cyclase family protein [Atribacterota bacterium]|nr:cyclase family protein [Atribacterota bacterium]